MSVEEEWRPVVGYEGLYEVSCLGRVRSLDTTERLFNSRHNVHFDRKRVGRILKLNGSRSHGYLSITLHRKAKATEYCVHRLVCEAFHGPRPFGADVAHRDATRHNNSAANLRWASRRSNLQDAHIKGFADLAGMTIDEAYAIIEARR